MAWQGKAGPGWAWRGLAWRGVAIVALLIGLLAGACLLVIFWNMGVGT